MIRIFLKSITITEVLMLFEIRIYSEGDEQ